MLLKKSDRCYKVNKKQSIRADKSVIHHLRGPDTQKRSRLVWVLALALSLPPYFHLCMYVCMLFFLFVFCIKRISIVPNQNVFLRTMKKCAAVGCRVVLTGAGVTSLVNPHLCITIFRTSRACCPNDAIFDPLDVVVQKCSRYFRSPDHLLAREVPVV